MQMSHVSAKQFNKAILRMMPLEFSEMGEGKFIASILTQGWADLHAEEVGFRSLAKDYFSNYNGALEKHCNLVGLDHNQIAKFVHGYLNGTLTYKIDTQDSRYFRPPPKKQAKKQATTGEHK
jgi:hypothetical protein